MGQYIRCIITDGNLTRDQLARMLPQISRRYRLEGDLLLHDAEAKAVLEFNHPGDGIMEDDVELLKRYAQAKQDSAHLASMLEKATSMIAAQDITQQGDEKEAPRSVLDPIWKWLLANRQALIVYEGGHFVDADGPHP
ncbi:hypothetical protein [Bremerella cremea]|uniref:hypothetical protein n=1 Tax=Bremerella cremea TaxID=1031537 RepID=UPI0031E6BC4C